MFEDLSMTHLVSMQLNPVLLVWPRRGHLAIDHDTEQWTSGHVREELVALKI
jgi:hypothetical protein